MMDSRRIEEVTVLDLQGRFDLNAIPKVGDLLDQMTSSGWVKLVINLRQVKFIDSMALATLVRITKRCRQRGGDVRLYGLQQPVRVIFELTRLDRAFDLFDDEEAAIRSFG